MKITLFFILILSALVTCTSTRQTTVVSYPPIPSLEESDVYRVTVNNTPIWTEKVRTDFDLESLPDWFTSSEYVNQQQEVHVTNFSCEGPIEVKVKLNEKVDSVSIHPKSRGITAGIQGKYFTFPLTGSNKLYIKVNNLPPLCFFANPLETERPDSTDEKVLYFGPGVHRPGMMHPQDSTTIYIAGGAIVYGGVETDGESNIKVIGRGILDGEFKYNRMVKLENSHNIKINGVIIRNGKSWTNTLINCDNVTYRHVKVISFRPGGDGINPLNSRNVTIDNCFLRCTDDCIAIKAPHREQITKNIRVINNTMIGFAYSDGVTIGFETNGSRISDVLVENCDVIQSRGGSRVSGHSAFSIICDGPAVISNVRYKDIRVEKDVLKLFELHITDGTKYGTDPPGHIQDVYLENIQWSSVRPIILHGFSSNHMVRNVTFEYCTIKGKLLTEKLDDVFQINEYVENVSFE